MLSFISNTSRVLNLAKCLSAHLFIRQSSPPRLASSGRSSEFKISVESGVLTREQVWRIKLFGAVVILLSQCIIYSLKYLAVVVPSRILFR